MDIAPLRPQWTAERVELLKQLWLKGWSGSEVARALEITKNAAIGKAHRLGLSRPAQTVCETKRLGARTVARTSKPRPPKRQALPSAVLPNHPTATILSVKAHMCRWPMGEPGEPGFGLCGRQKASGGSYCAAHARIAYQPNAETNSDQRRTA